jgi:hypothetical protein
MGLHDPFGHLKHKLWLKERPRVKLVVWLPTIKSWESTRFCCVQVVCVFLWQALDEDYNFALNFILIGGLHVKLWGPKIVGISTLEISRFPLGSPRTKCHLDVGLVERHKVYYKGEGDGLPQVRTMVSLVSSSFPMARLNTKNVPIMH